MGRTAHLCNGQNAADRRYSPCPPLRIICTPSMARIESSLGLLGLALAWESAVAVGVALAAGILLGLALRGRLRGRRTAAAPDAAREREVESLRRVAGELARASDVEGVVRALLDEIATLFDVGFLGLSFISEDGREASGFLARSEGRDVDWWREVRVDLALEPSGIASAVFEAASFAVYDVTDSSRVSA